MPGFRHTVHISSYFLGYIKGKTTFFLMCPILSNHMLKNGHKKMDQCRHFLVHFFIHCLAFVVYIVMFVAEYREASQLA